MGACTRNMYSDCAEIKPAQCCIKLVFHLTDLFIVNVRLNSNINNYLSIFCCFIRPLFMIFHSSTYIPCGPGSTVGIATVLGAGRSVIESRWGRDFPPVQTDPGAQTASCTMGTGSFPGVKVRPGHAADHLPPSSVAVMEE